MTEGQRRSPGGSSGRPGRPAEAAGGHAGAGPGADQLGALLGRVARGDQDAYAAVYDRTAGRVLGLVLSIVRDPAQSEEVTQEVLLDVWRSASRFDAGLGSAAAWVMTLAHRRAVDRVRSEQKATEREMRVASSAVAYDEVAEAVEARLDRERVRRCLGSLTELQRESVTLAYYGGYTYREVAGLLGVAIGTVKTRMRDGLIRLRDCLGVDPGGPAAVTRTPWPGRMRWMRCRSRTGPGSSGTWLVANRAVRRYAGCARRRRRWPPPRRCGRPRRSGIRCCARPGRPGSCRRRPRRGRRPGTAAGPGGAPGWRSRWPAPWPPWPWRQE